MDEMIRAVVTADTANFESGMKRAQSRAESLAQSFRGAVLKIGAVVGLSEAVSAFNTIRNSIDQMNDRAARLEIPVEDLQRLEAAASMSGSSVETLSKALNKAQLAAVNARDGSSGLADSFAALNINSAEFLSATPTERLLALSRGFNTAADKGTAFKAVFDIMGKGASELIPLLRDGEAGIEAISQRLKVLGGEDVAAVAKLNDEIDLLAANVKTDVAGAFIALRPQIEAVVKLVADAADGLAIFLDPAKGIGRQGGESGGLQMLKEMDRLRAEIPKLKEQMAGKSWSEGVVGLEMALKGSEESLAALEARYAGLTSEVKLYAEQLYQVDKLKASGLSGADLEREVAALQGRTAEAIRAAEEERAIAAAAAGATAELEKQEAAAKATADALGALQEKVAGRVLAAQPPDVRQDFARKGLADILQKQNVGSVDDLRRKVGTSKTDEERLGALKALDEALDKLADIKRAQEEIATAGQQHWEAWKKAISDSHDAAVEAEKAGRDLVKNAADAEKEKATAFQQQVAAAQAAAQLRAQQLQPLANVGSFKQQQQEKRDARHEQFAAERNARGQAVRDKNAAAAAARAAEREARFPGLSKKPAGIEQGVKRNEKKEENRNQAKADGKSFEQQMSEMKRDVEKIRTHFEAIGAG